MSSKLRNKRQLWLIVAVTCALLLLANSFWLARGGIWSVLDYQALDPLYRRAVSLGKGPPLSPRIVYVAITDDTYTHLGGNELDRTFLARTNATLAELGAEAVAYDIIFARPSDPSRDRIFARSVKALGVCYLPVGLAVESRPASPRVTAGQREALRGANVRIAHESGRGRPYYAGKVLSQLKPFALAARGSGHISAFSDTDGVYRRAIMLIKSADGYVPTLALRMFLDYVQVPFTAVRIVWGEHILIPAQPESYLERTLIVPIDERGRTFIPMPATWQGGFAQITPQDLLSNMRDLDLRGNLLDRIDGQFVFVGDVSSGASDLGQTVLEADVPLVAMHTALLNTLLTDSFYTPWRSRSALILLTAIILALGFAAMFKTPWVLYFAGAGGLLLLPAFAWLELLDRTLFPVTGVSASVLIDLAALIVALQWVDLKERRFIRSAFSMYLPDPVIERLLKQPDKLKLGGEQRELTVLFSDIRGFTTISESLEPVRLVALLNEYLTEMTAVILAEGGIIDKFVGDAIMAEFGAPLPAADHADRAVRAALGMQRRLAELRDAWRQTGMPDVHCRIGINTGSMVIGNMGSRQVFDYTVIGDAVNLAARLEGANKRYGTEIMIAESTRVQLTGEQFLIRPLDVLRVKGKTIPVRVYEVYGDDRSRIRAADNAYYSAYGRAMEAYLMRDFDTARALFSEALKHRPDDPPTEEFLRRVAAARNAKLPDDWDGSLALDTK